MKISVILPFYRELDLIGQTIQSVFAQSALKNGVTIEVIIGNDGPHTEEEIRLAIGEEVDSQVRIVKNHGAKGPGGARNAAIAISEGDLLAFLDADDQWHETKLEHQLQLIREGYNFIATAYQFKGQRVIVTPPEKITHATDIFFKLGIGTSTVLMTRKLRGSLIFRDLRFSQDIDYWFRLASQEEFAYGMIPDVLTDYSSFGSTRNKWDQLISFHKVLRINKINLGKKCVILSKYTIRGILNHYIRR